MEGMSGFRFMGDESDGLAAVLAAMMTGMGPDLGSEGFQNPFELPSQPSREEMAVAQIVLQLVREGLPKDKVLEKAMAFKFKTICPNCDKHGICSVEVIAAGLTTASDYKTADFLDLIIDAGITVDESLSFSEFVEARRRERGDATKPPALTAEMIQRAVEQGMQSAMGGDFQEELAKTLVRAAAAIYHARRDKLWYRRLGRWTAFNAKAIWIGLFVGEPENVLLRLMLSSVHSSVCKCSYHRALRVRKSVLGAPRRFRTSVCFWWFGVRFACHRTGHRVRGFCSSSWHWASDWLRKKKEE